MKRILSLVMAAMLLLSAFAFAEDVPNYYMPGDKMVDFTVTMSDGTEMNLYKLLETKELVILNFWATWCGPCRMEFPFMEEAYLKYQDQVEIIALSVEPTDTNDVIEAFKAENGLSALPMGQDITGVSGNFYFEGIPTSVAIDRFGVICWQESSSITSTDKFERLFNSFLGEDYTESQLLYAIPAPKPTVANASDADLASALNVEGGTIAFANDADEMAWPFLPTEDGKVKSTNSTYDETSAILHAKVSAKAGDALAFDYVVSSEASMDYLLLEVNGEIVTIFSGENAGAYAYAFEADGDYAVTFTYYKDAGESSGEDYAAIDNVQVLSGDAAAAALAALPEYPLTLEGAAYELAALNGKAAAVTDEVGVYTAQMGDFPSYIMDGAEGTFHIKLGKDLDPAQAFVYDDYTRVYRTVADMEQDENGFVVTFPLSSVEGGGYSSTYVFLYPDFVENPNVYGMYYVYANEENMNYFIYAELPAYGISGVSWTYADGSAPATDAIAQEAAETELPDGMAQYVVYFVDQNGDPVPNVMAQVCDAETCQVIPSDENGIVACVLNAYAYEIHVLMSPEGYTFDTQKVYVMPEAGGELIIDGIKN